MRAPAADLTCGTCARVMNAMNPLPRHGLTLATHHSPGRFLRTGCVLPINTIFPLSAAGGQPPAVGRQAICHSKPILDGSAAFAAGQPPNPPQLTADSHDCPEQASFIRNQVGDRGSGWVPWGAANSNLIFSSVKFGSSFVLGGCVFGDSAPAPHKRGLVQSIIPLCSTLQSDASSPYE